MLVLFLLVTHLKEKDRQKKGSAEAPSLGPRNCYAGLTAGAGTKIGTYKGKCAPANESGMPFYGFTFPIP